MNARAKELRERLAKRELVNVPSCPDPFFARIAESVGFEAIALGGYAQGAQSTRREPLLTMTEVVDAARSIVQAVGIPLIVDGGAGFGDPMHTMRTVRELEAAGAAAVHIEDQVFPKRAHYHRNYQEHLIPAEEMALKITFAREARQTQDFIIIARTDAMQTHGYAEGINRVNRYADAGADLAKIFPTDDDQARNAPRDCSIPLIYVNSSGNRTGRPIYTADELNALGYCMCIDAISVTISGYLAVKQLLTRLKSTGVAGLDPTVARSARLEVERLIGLEAYYAIEERTVERSPAAVDG